MTVILNQAGLAHARDLIGQDKVALDEKGDWSKHQPSTEQEDAFILSHGLAEYGQWHLAIDDQQGNKTKGRFEFPYGDFTAVRRSALLAAESRAGQYKHTDIEDEAKRLLAMLKG